MNADGQIYFQGFMVPSKDVDLKILIPHDNDHTFDDILPMRMDRYFTVQRLEWNDFSGEITPNSPWLAHTFWNISYTYETISEESKPSQQQFSNGMLKKDRLPSVASQSPEPQNQENKDKNGIISKPPLRLPPVINRQDIASRQRQIPVSNNGRLRSPSPQSRQLYYPSPRSNAHLRQQQEQRRNSGSVQRSNSQQSLKKSPGVSSSQFRIEVKAKCYLTKKSWVRYEQKELLEHERGHYLLGSLCALEFKRQAESQTWEENEQTETLKSQVTMFFSKILRQFLDVEKQYDVETAHYCEQQMQLLWNRRIKEQLKLYEIYFNP